MFATPVRRREFLNRSVRALLAAGVWTETAPRARGAPQKLRIGAIGVGNRGEYNLLAARDEQIVALCDVDDRHLQERGERFPGATLYRDYREMFEHERFDAVLVSTPDHAHAHAALLAMRKGWHVYCEKPLATTIAETRRMAATAARYRVVTQTGNQHHATLGYRRAMQWLQAGLLGDVTEVHAWTDRPFWPQGIARPAPSKTPPQHLEWDLWLNVAPERPYADGYHPTNWRGFWDFGTGAPGDRGMHLIDPAFSGLRLTLPRRVEAESSPVNDETLPEWSVVKFDFPARGELPPVRLIWYDGGKRPSPSLVGLSQLPPNGSLVLGTRARMFIPELGGEPKLLAPPGGKPPRDLPADAPAPPTHFDDWLEACREGRAASYDFAAGARLTETCLLGNLAIRIGKPLAWDAQAGRAPQTPEADRFLDREYRQGWKLPDES